MGGFNFGAFPILQTARLRLRRIDKSDLGDWFTVFCSPGVADFLIDFDSAPSEDYIGSFINWADEIYASQTGIRWALTLQPADRLIGTCGFHLYNQRDRRAEIGYELHSAYWRRGLMSEATTAVMGFCFDELALHRLEADVVEGNGASAALLQKLGFTLEGVWRERIAWRGGHHSMWQFGLLAGEYRALIKAGRLF